MTSQSKGTEPAGSSVASLPDLLARQVEAATGPDRELDAEIARHFGWRHVCFVKTPHQDWRGIRPGSVGPGRTKLPLFTASLDAALALCERVLPGSGIMLNIGSFKSATIWPVPLGASQEGIARTPALALLAAMLKALDASPKADTNG